MRRIVFPLVMSAAMFTPPMHWQFWEHSPHPTATAHQSNSHPTPAMLRWIRNHMRPQEVFARAQLARWAQKHDYTTIP
jgi:hypothetical protein